MTEYASASPVTIVGAGFSAMALASQLMQRGIPVRVIGPARDFACGLAYGGNDPGHMLNVPADRMGVDAARPAAFADHLGLEGEARRAFLPRAAYGRFLRQHWQALRESQPARVEGIEASVEEIRPLATGGFSLRLDDGRGIEARRLVLALGTAPLPPASAAGRVIDDPWAGDAFDGVDIDDPVLVLGTSLTMIDIVTRLLRAGHRGRITALSRRGLLPRRHPEPPLPPQAPSPALLDALQAGRLAEAVRRYRQETSGGSSPDALADGLRPQVAAIWRAWPLPVRSRFLRHLRPWWDHVRHRVPADAMKALEAAAARGLFGLRAGRLAGFGNDEARVTPRSARDAIAIPARWIVDATGWDGDPARFARHPALRGLIAAGAARPDALGLGLACDADGRVFGAHGITRNLHVIGGLRRGECWESSAVPELRAQAQALAARLAEDD